MPRIRLPNRRGGINFEFACRNTIYTALLSFDLKNELKEVFIRSGKVGTDVDIVMQEAAVLLSFMLQYGGSSKEVRAAMPRMNDGTAEGPIGTLLDKLEAGIIDDAKRSLLE